MWRGKEKGVGKGQREDSRRKGERRRTDREGQLGSRPAIGRAVGRVEKIQFRWEGMFQGTRQDVEGGEEGLMPTCFGTYNIRNGRNVGL